MSDISYEIDNDGKWPADLVGNVFNSPGKQPLQLLIELIESQEVFICPTDPDPEDYSWYYSGSLKKPDFIDNKCSYMVNEDAVWFFKVRTSKVFRRTLLDHPTEWLEMTDGNANLHSASRTWEKIAPGAASGRLNWWHPRDTVSGLYGDGSVKTVNAVSGPTISVEPEDY